MKAIRKQRVFTTHTFVSIKIFTNQLFANQFRIIVINSLCLHLHPKYHTTRENGNPF